MVSGIALCVFNYMVLSWIRRKPVDMKCLDVMGMYLFYALVTDATIEGLDWIHRIYSAEEGFQMMQYMARVKLFYTLSLGQVVFGSLVPLILLGVLQLVRRRVPELARRRMYFGSAMLILVGVLAMRWNVVIGGQLFSKTLRGIMSYKMAFAGLEGWYMGGGAHGPALCDPGCPGEALPFRTSAGRRPTRSRSPASSPSPGGKLTKPPGNWHGDERPRVRCETCLRRWAIDGWPLAIMEMPPGR